jgi:uncharacterized protein YegJ (DUF2314 family)
MRWLYLISILFLVTSCTIITEKNVNETGILEDTHPDVKQLSKGDIRFLKAKETAQENINYFIDALSQYNDSLTYSLKTDFVDNLIHEHMWVEISYYKNGLFFGFVANDPEDVKNYKYGDWVNISKTEVEDWMIWNQETNEYQGYFSEEVLH